MGAPEGEAGGELLSTLSDSSLVGEDMATVDSKAREMMGDGVDEEDTAGGGSLTWPVSVRPRVLKSSPRDR